MVVPAYPSQVVLRIKYDQTWSAAFCNIWRHIFGGVWMDMAMDYKFNLTCFSAKKGIFTPHLTPHRQDWLKTDHSWYSVLMEHSFSGCAPCNFIITSLTFPLFWDTCTYTMFMVYIISCLVSNKGCCRSLSKSLVNREEKYDITSPCM